MAAQAHAASLSNHDAATYRTNANFVYSAAYTSAVLGLLDAQPGEAICDVGCGSGELTALIKAQVGAGEVVGIDSSADMIDKAKASTAGIAYHQLDIMDPASVPAELHGRFDAVFTSATLHWCKRDPAGAAATIRLLLKPGGRVAYEFGGFGNTVGVRAAIHQVLRQNKIDPVPLDPWYFPTPEQYNAPGAAALYPRPTPLPTNLAGWLTTFVRNTFFADFDTAKQDDLIEQVHHLGRLLDPDGRPPELDGAAVVLGRDVGEGRDAGPDRRRVVVGQKRGRGAGCPVVEMCRIDNFWTDATPGSGLKPSAGSGAKEGWEIMYVRLRGTASKPL